MEETNTAALCALRGHKYSSPAAPARCQRRSAILYMCPHNTMYVCSYYNVSAYLQPRLRAVKVVALHEALDELSDRV